jgi:cell division FtsZ-interacting protein ZapD
MLYNTEFNDYSIDEIMQDQRNFIKSLLRKIDHLQNQIDALYANHNAMYNILEATGLKDQYLKEMEKQKKITEIQNSGSNYNV